MTWAGWRAWNALTALSLVLCLASAGFWVRSYWFRDIAGLGWAGGNPQLVQSLLGRLHVHTTLGGGYTGGATYQADRLSPRAIWSGGMSSYPLVADLRWRLGFLWQTYSRHHMGMGQPYVSSHRLIVVPYWFPTGVLALAPVAWAAGLRRRVGVVDLLLIVAAIALLLAVPLLLVRSMNLSRSDSTPEAGANAGDAGPPIGARSVSEGRAVSLRQLALAHASGSDGHGKTSPTQCRSQASSA